MKTNRNASKRASSQPSKRITNIRKNQRIGKYIANKTHEKKELYVDAEWFISQRMYLLGYAYNLRQYGQLYGKALCRENVRNMLRNVDTVYFWGPDIGMLEKCFRISIRNRVRCINLLKVMHYIEPNAISYKLAHFESLAGIHRKTMEYKSNIWTLHRDWKDPQKRQRALLYNMEDVLNMLRVKRYFWKKHGITREHEDMFSM